MTTWAPAQLPGLDGRPTKAPLPQGFGYLPTVPREYPEFYRAPRWRWWKPVLALLTFSFGWVLATALVSVPFAIWWYSQGLSTPEQMVTALSTTALGFLANNLTIIAAIPVAMLTQWWLFGQRPGWLSSVTKGIRWSWFVRCLVVIAPLWIGMTFLEYWLDPFPMEARPDTWLMLATVLLTTPFQCAGEEYATRGLINRSVASFFPSKYVGLVGGALVSSTVFMLLHGAGDVWLNVFYFTFAMIACFLTWWTGGLEASIAVHVVNNMTSLALTPWQDLSGLFQREAGTVTDPLQILINLAMPTIGALLIVWQAKRVRPVRSAGTDGYRRTGVPASPELPPQGFAPAEPAGFVPSYPPYGYPSAPQGYPPQPVPQGYPPQPVPQGYPPQPLPQGYPPPAQNYVPAHAQSSSPPSSMASSWAPTPRYALVQEAVAPTPDLPAPPLAPVAEDVSPMLPAPPRFDR
ncbi:MAG TPA: hypothetical protein DEG88_06145 [Propionibacteriaceae bacterium]|nr:hypothetical protein [Propionibacteriaceae bacterium]